MKNLIALTILALGLATGIANSASAKSVADTVRDEVFQPKGP